ncbi:MAG TPA: hypothetical protein VD995_03045 [Azospirillum sp.]|nr:hypothetical protein [Azospirillum sp.]
MSGFTPIDLAAAVQTRISGSVADLKHTTAGAVEFAELVSKKLLPARLPAAFVVAGALVGDGVRRVGAVSIEVAQAVTVILVQGSAKDATGEAARAACWPLEWAVIDCLTGWAPAEGYAELLFEEDALRGLGGEGRTGAVAATLTFTTEWKLHKRTTGGA